MPCQVTKDHHAVAIYKDTDLVVHVYDPKDSILDTSRTAASIFRGVVSWVLSCSQFYKGVVSCSLGHFQGEFCISLVSKGRRFRSL